MRKLEVIPLCPVCNKLPTFSTRTTTDWAGKKTTYYEVFCKPHFKKERYGLAKLSIKDAKKAWSKKVKAELKNRKTDKDRFNV